MLDIDFKLYVRSMTYNQHQYITDTMNGFVLQRTTFPYVCCIVDDASTDGNNIVIKEYFKENFDLFDKDAFLDKETDYGFVSYARHKTNINCHFLVILLKENHYQNGREYVKDEYIKEWVKKTEYVSLCEGDDYWIHPDKLQIQVDYLDKHPEVVVSCHRCNIREERDGSSKVYLRPYDQDMSRYQSTDVFMFDFKEYFAKGYWIAEYHATVLRNIYDPNYWKGCHYTRDVHMMFYLLKHGLGVCHSFIGGVYRRNNSGIFSSLQQYHLAETQNNVFTEIFALTQEPIFAKLIVHYRFLLLKNHKYKQHLDTITLMAWKLYIKYLFKTTIHSLVPKRFRRSLKKQDV